MKDANYADMMGKNRGTETIQVKWLDSKMMKFLTKEK